MPKYFIITGLPRTRTAWLSALFSDGNVMCFHEPCNNFKSLVEMKVYLDSLPFEYVGISDSSVAYNLDFYIDNFPDAPILFVNRNKEEVVVDLCDFLGNGIEFSQKIVDNLEEGIARLKTLGVLSIEFEDLDCTDIIELAWFAMVGDTPFNEVRCNMFQSLMIQQHKEKVLQNLK